MQHWNNSEAQTASCIQLPSEKDQNLQVSGAFRKNHKSSRLFFGKRRQAPQIRAVCGRRFIHSEGILKTQWANFSEGRQQAQSKHVPSFIEDQIKLVLIEIKHLRPSLKIKSIEVHLKEVKSTNLIGIQVNQSSFKYKLEIESDDFLFVYL